MVARENKVFYVFGASALVIFLALVGFTEYPSWVNTVVLFVVGIFVPLLVNDLLDDRES
ncbi:MULTISPECIES: hypothetical protein [Halobacteriales]|uniref:Uncharacterized protein n=1 Tax=Natranaeroarchaeum aerophilus TaxID=2917711 RepID=A0AAE3FRW8_9EURY|nr:MULTISPECIES: hypothetical protein [Halobacteria]MCL9814507.1 hypothetical protein [Natranaeroarchaeum aerophilus]MDR5673635.1 hypothetical protein [Halalkaliarchaeum sp. AArc-GB]